MVCFLSCYQVEYSLKLSIVLKRSRCATYTDGLIDAHTHMYTTDGIIEAYNILSTVSPTDSRGDNKGLPTFDTNRGSPSSDSSQSILYLDQFPWRAEVNK